MNGLLPYQENLVGIMTVKKTDVETMDALSALMARAKLDRNQDHQTLPPVELWEPDFCGDLDLEIKADGTWFYMGTPIGRHSMVRLFSTVLRKDDDGKTYLVTPVEKVGIRVEDAHFLAVELTVTSNKGDQIINLRTNMGDIVQVGKNNPLWFDVSGPHAELKPYVRVRGRLDALVNRATMYELIELGEEIIIDDVNMFALRSSGEVFPIMPMDQLQAEMTNL